MSRRSSRFVAHLSLTLITLCLFCDILRLAPSASAVSVTHLTHRRDVSGTNNPSLNHGALSPSEGSKRRNVGDDISNTFNDVFDKVDDVFKPSDDKKMTAVEMVSEYAYIELDHGIEFKKLQESFQKLHDGMEHGDNKTDDGGWIHKQIKDTIPGLKETFENANGTEVEEKKRFVRSLHSVVSSDGLSSLNVDTPVDDTGRETLEKRDVSITPPVLSGRYMDMLAHAVKMLREDRMPPCFVMLRGCDRADKAFSPEEHGKHTEDELRQLV